MGVAGTGVEAGVAVEVTDLALQDREDRSQPRRGQAPRPMATLPRTAESRAVKMARPNDRLVAIIVSSTGGADGQQPLRSRPVGFSGDRPTRGVETCHRHVDVGWQRSVGTCLRRMPFTLAFQLEMKVPPPYCFGFKTPTERQEPPCNPTRLPSQPLNQRTSHSPVSFLKCCVKFEGSVKHSERRNASPLANEKRNGVGGSRSKP